MGNIDYDYIGSLVELVQDGDSNAFAELYAATYRKQYYIANQYLKDEYLAQDALQETYINALKNIHSLKEPKLFIAWLNQINFRICYKLSEQQKRYNSEMADYDEYAEQYASSAVDPEAQAIDIENNKCLVKQIMALPFSESQAIMLRYYNNMKIDEIAEIMDCSRSTVKRNIASGQKRLKKLIKDSEV